MLPSKANGMKKQPLKLHCHCLELYIQLIAVVLTLILFLKPSRNEDVAAVKNVLFIFPRQFPPPH